MKVASYFTLKNADKNLLELWIKSLPLRAASTLAERLWLKSQGKSAVLWTSENGFEFF